MLNKKVFSLLPRIFSLASLLLPTAVHAYDFYPGPGKDIRKSSLGVGAVVADSKGDVFTNPANLATDQKDHQWGGSLNAYLPFNQLAAGAFYQNSIFGLGISYDQTKLSATPDSTYPQVDKQYSEKRFGLGAAMTLWKLKVGAKGYYNLQTLNYILGILPDVQRTNQNFSADLGTQFALSETINLGLMFGNLSVPGTDDKGLYFNGRNPFAALGATYEFSPRFKFNAGLKNEYDNEYGFKNLQLGLGAEARILYFSFLGQHAVLKGRLSFNPVVGQGISNTAAQDILSYAAAGIGLQFNQDSDYREKINETVDITYTSKKVYHLQVETKDVIKKYAYTAKLDWEELSHKKYFEAEVVIRKLDPILVHKFKKYLKEEKLTKAQIANDFLVVELEDGFYLPIGFINKTFKSSSKNDFDMKKVESFKKKVILTEAAVEKIRHGGNMASIVDQIVNQIDDLEDGIILDKRGHKYTPYALKLTHKKVKALPQEKELKLQDFVLNEEEYKMQNLQEYLIKKHNLNLKDALNIKLMVNVAEDAKAAQVTIKKYNVVMGQAEAEDLLKQFESKTFIGNIPGLDATELNIVNIQKIKEEEVDKKEIKTVRKESETVYQPNEAAFLTADVLFKADRSSNVSANQGFFVGAQINYYYGKK